MIGFFAFDFFATSRARNWILLVLPHRRNQRIDQTRPMLESFYVELTSCDLNRSICRMQWTSVHESDADVVPPHTILQIWPAVHSSFASFLVDATPLQPALSRAGFSISSNEFCFSDSPKITNDVIFSQVGLDFIGGEYLHPCRTSPLTRTHLDAGPMVGANCRGFVTADVTRGNLDWGKGDSGVQEMV